MAYVVRFSPAERLGAVELTGRVRWAEVEAALHALFGHPAWAPGIDVLWDASAVAAVDVAPEDLPAARATMERLAAARAGGRSAVITRSETEAALVVLFTRLGAASERAVGVFDAAAGALAFLGRVALPGGLPVIAASAP